MDNSEGQQIIMMAPSGFFEFLRDYSKIEDFGFDQLICCNSSDFRNSNHMLNPDIECLLKNAQTVRVTHCPDAFAVVLDIKDDTNVYRVSYSGDCRPSSDFAKAGQNSDILIHEATFDDEMKSEAVAKKHCTIGEALEIGKL